MRTLIYGAGAVGCFIGGHLALGGHTVTLLGREPLAAAVRSEGLCLQLPGGEHTITPIRAETTLEGALKHGPYDLIAFTMKAYDTVPAIFELQNRLPDPPPIVCFQNGVGNEESLASAFGPEKVIAGTLASPVSIPRPGTVVEARSRGIVIALDTPSSQTVFPHFEKLALTVGRAASSRALKWSKLLLNMLGNATCAILDMLPSQVFKHRDLFALERAAFLEALAIMHLHDIPVIDLPGLPVRVLAAVMKHVPPFLFRPVLRQQMASGRGDKPPSFLLDLRAGRRRTEIAWLNGAVVQAADQLDRLAPVNHALALTLSDITAGRAAWDLYRGQPDMLLTAVRIAQGT